MMAPHHIARPRQAVVLAGGRGARMRPYTDTAPKHMYPFHGRPFAAALVEQLADQGFERILFLLGYLPRATREYFADGARWGVRIDYAETPAEWESAARLSAAVGQLEESFLLCYCDNLWPLKMLALWQAWQRSGTLAQVTVYENGDGWTRSNVAVEGTRLARYDASRSEAAGLSGVEIGYALVARAVVERLGEATGGWAAEAYPGLAAQGQLAAFVTAHRYYSVGTPERLEATGAYLSGRPMLLLDRDGVLNRRPAPGDYVKSAAEWEWLPGALPALARFHRAGFRVAVISNQAGVGRGAMTAAALAEIEARLRADVAAAGGAIDAIYTCPHDWDAGCRCRKPQPGMLWQAQRDFHLNLTETWFLGDDERDAQAAEAAGCRFAFVSERTPLSGYADVWLSGREQLTSCVSS